MTVKYGFYDSLNGDRLYNANDISTMFDGLFSDGVFEFVGGGLQVENSPGTMNVLVNTGRAWFNNLWIRNTSTLVLPISPSDLIHDRIDLVVLEFDSSITVRENSIKVLTGIPAPIPIPQVLANTSTLKQYPLAEIYVAATVSEIEPTDITSKIGTIITPYATSLLSQGVSDHGELTGLLDDDHPQYLKSIPSSIGVLSSIFTVTTPSTAGSPVFEATGLKIVLPTPDTYRVQAVIRIDQQTNGVATYTWMQGKIKNNTSGSYVPYTEFVGAVGSAGVTFLCSDFITVPLDITTTVPNTELEVWLAAVYSGTSPTWTLKRLVSDANSKSTISYLRLTKT